MNKNKVAFRTDFSLESSGAAYGPAAVSIALVEALAEMPELEIHVVSCNAGMHKTYIEEREGSYIHRIPTKGGLRLVRCFTTDARKVRKVYEKINPDIIHSQGSSEYVFGGKELGVPVALRIHGIEVLHPNFSDFHPHSKFLKEIYLKQGQLFLLKKAIRNSSAIIGISTYITNALAKLHEENKVYVIHNPVRKEIFESGSPTQEQTNVALYAGCVMGLKNLIDL